jgi:hypothetical protein
MPDNFVIVYSLDDNTDVSKTLADVIDIIDRKFSVKLCSAFLSVLCLFSGFYTFGFAFGDLKTGVLFSSRFPTAHLL